MHVRPAGGRLLVHLAPLLGFGALPACSGGTPIRAVVLVTCDTLRTDRLGYHGWTRSTTPGLDALAAESIVYESAWSTAPLTGPALSAVMTGLRPEDLGVENNSTLLAQDAVTLAERLAAEGVDTAAVVSNWVLREHRLMPEAGVRQGFASFDDDMADAEVGRPDVRERIAPDTTDRALAWLDGRADDGPFFLWVHYQDPHGPYTPPPHLAPSPDPDELGEPVLVPGGNDGFGTLPAYQVLDDERRPAAYRALYDGEIRFFDQELGRLLDGLRKRGVLDSALVVFSADHGESLGEHGYWFSHGQNLHRELLHVPLLVRPPGGASPPRRVATPVTHLDVYPTVLGHFGLRSPTPYGVDLLAGSPPGDRLLHSSLIEEWSVTSGSERLIRRGDALQLYDLARDPGELHDLARERPERVEALVRAREELLSGAAVTPLEPATPNMSARELRELRALGYGGDGDGDEH